MEMQTPVPSTPPPKISMAMLRELKAALPDDDDDYEVVPPKAEAVRAAVQADSNVVLEPQPKDNVVPIKPAPAPEEVSASDYAAKTAAAIAASGLGATAAAAAVNAASATGQPTQAAKPPQGTIHLNPSVTRGEPKVAAPRSSPRAQARAEARANPSNEERIDRMATPAERAMMLGFKPFTSMFGQKPKSVGLSNEMLGQWEQGIAAASLKDASLSAADAHSALTNTPKDALKGDVEAAAKKAADAVGKFEKAAQSASLIRDPLAKEQALTNVKSATEQFGKTLDGAKEKFGDVVNFDAMMKQMKEMADKIAEMMAKVAEAIQSVLPGPKR
jgi:hypothetical protein